MIEEIRSLAHEGVEVFSTLTEAQLRNKIESEKGIFIAESPKVIHVALDAGLEPLALLCERKHINGDASSIIGRCEKVYQPTPDHPTLPVYTGERDLLAQLTGYTLTRGVLCAMRRPRELSVEEVCLNARRVVVIDGVVDTTNIGAIFRSAAALGIDGVLLTPNSCDPFNRRAVRVSMGSVFLVPWAWLRVFRNQSTSRLESREMRDDGFSLLKRLGFRTAAMALSNDSISLSDPILKQEQRLAIVMGTEGDGLPEDVIRSCDYIVRIPMAHGVDSLNVAAASAVAFWELRKEA